MPGLPHITYKGQDIIYLDYSTTGGSKEKVLQLLKACEEEYGKYPPKSAIGLTNCEGLNFDKDILGAIKSSQDKVNPYVKKIALIGMRPVHKAAYNFVLAVTTNKFMKVFDSELEAKEWLIND